MEITDALSEQEMHTCKVYAKHQHDTKMRQKEEEEDRQATIAGT